MPRNGLTFRGMESASRDRSHTMSRRLHTTHVSRYDELPVRISRVASYWEDEDEAEPEDTTPEPLVDRCECGQMKEANEPACDDCAETGRDGR